MKTIDQKYPKILKDYSYKDRFLHIRYEQTISQLYIVAFMGKVLEIHKNSKALGNKS